MSRANPKGRSRKLQRLPLDVLVRAQHGARAGRGGMLGHYPFVDNPISSSSSHSCTISLACSLA